MISQDDVKKVAKLSHIEIKADEIEAITKKLSSTIAWVEKLNELDTEGVEPMASVEAKLRMREDQSDSESHIEEVLSNSCDREYDFFAVPKVIE